MDVLDKEEEEGQSVGPEAATGKYQEQLQQWVSVAMVSTEPGSD